MRFFPNLVAAMLLCVVTSAFPQEKQSPEPTKPLEAGESQESSPYLPTPDDPRLTVELNHVCRNLQNSHKCAEAVEKAQLPRYPLQVSRRGPILRLTLKTGKVVELKDVDMAARKQYDQVDKTVFYNFREYLQDLGYFLIHLQYHEGNAYLMVNDRTGQRYTLHDLFLLSPDQQRLATVTMFDAYNPTAIQIWRITPEKMTLEWSWNNTDEDWGPKNGAWQDNITLTFDKTGWEGMRREKMMVRREASEWKLLPLKP